MARIVSLDFLAIFKVFGLDAADADAGTILDSGQAPSPHAQGWNKPQGETPRSDNRSEGFPLRLIPGREGRGLARIQNCSAGVGGGVQPKYLKNSQKVQTQNPRHWGLENRLGAVQHAILHRISPRYFLVSQFIREIYTKPQIYEKLKNIHLRLHTKTTHNFRKSTSKIHMTHLGHIILI